MSTRTLAGILSAIILTCPVASFAQKPMELTALDYIQIQQLVAKYARAIDTCSNNGYDYADLYTADGVFAPVVNGDSFTEAKGREKLAEVSGGGSKGCKNVGWIKQGVHHIYVNHIITPTPEGATGTVNMLMIGLKQRPEQDRPRRLLRRHLREDAARVALQAAHSPRVAQRRPSHERGAGGREARWE